ncbi:MAG: hypothetical protein ACJA01_002022 [Saprospiraceae bacterium]
MISDSTQDNSTFELQSNSMNSNPDQNSIIYKFPTGVKILNKVLDSYDKKELVAEQLMEQAQKKAGLTDFGDEFFIAPLKEVLKDVNENTPFHPMGAFLYHEKIKMNLVNRLWAQYWLKQDSSILKPLPPALMITGLQRTGTTFLQRLLGSLPEFRGVISWEIVNPVPTSQKKSYYGKYQAWLSLFALNYINPELKSIHAVEYDSLDEEVVLMEHAFMSSVNEAAMTVPNYARWLEQQDQTRAYQDLKMWLQFLLWRQPADKFLLLKSPHHMEYLDSFMSVYPDTHVIQMHRSPEKTLASFCSMSTIAKKLFQTHVNPHEVGKHWLRKNKRLVDHCTRYRSKGEGSFTDIAYRDLIADPLAVARKIYEQLGLQWTEEHTTSAKAFFVNHKKNKFGKHAYSLEDYGLTESQVKGTFEEYRDTYQAYL